MPVKRGTVVAIGQVADLDLRLAPGRAETVLGDAHGDTATNDVASGSDPRALLQLQSESDGLRERAVHGGGERRGLEHDHAHHGAPRVRRQP